MAGADDIFGAFQDPSLAREAQEDARQLSFEERVVKGILRYANVPLRVGKAKSMAKEHRGSTSLGFQWFSEQFPEYPINLSSAKLRHTGEIKMNQLFGRGFMRLSFVKEFMGIIDSEDWNPHTERCAMVWNLPHAHQASTMVLHNQPVQANITTDAERRAEPETRILRPFGHPRVTYVVESLNSFMDTVGTEWAADLCQASS